MPPFLARLVRELDETEPSGGFEAAFAIADKARRGEAMSSVRAALIGAIDPEANPAGATAESWLEAEGTIATAVEDDASAEEWLQLFIFSEDARPPWLQVQVLVSMV
jgi:hypothetical protein